MEAVANSKSESPGCRLDVVDLDDLLATLKVEPGIDTIWVFVEPRADFGS